MIISLVWLKQMPLIIYKKRPHKSTEYGRHLNTFLFAIYPVDCRVNCIRETQMIHFKIYPKTSKATFW